MMIAGKFTYSNRFTKEELAIQLNKLYNDNIGVWISHTGRVTENNRFFNGDQWSYEEKQIFFETNRPPAVWNIVKRAVLQLTGDMEKKFQRTRFTFPSGTGGAKGSNSNQILSIVNDIHTYFYDLAGAKDTFVDAFLSSLIQGFSLIKITTCRDKVETDWFDGLSVMFDPTSTKLDLSDCAYVIISKDYSKDTLKALYPDCEQIINNGTISPDNRTITATVRPHYADGVTVREYWVRDAENMMDGDMGRVIVVKVIASTNNILAIEAPPHSVLPFVLVAPLINKSSNTLSDRFTAFVKESTDSQQQVNRLMQLMVSIPQQTLNSAVIVDRGALEDPKALDFGLKNGVVYTKPNTDVGKAISRMPTVEIPPSLVNAVQNALSMIFSALGLTPVQMGENGEPNQTASLMEMKMIESDTATAKYKASFRRSQQAFSKKFMMIILQSACTGEVKRREEEQLIMMTGIDHRDIMEILGVCKKNIDFETLSLNGSYPIEARTVLEMIKIVRNCSVVFTHSIDSETNRQIEFAKLQQLMQMGVPIPPRILLESAGVDNIDEISQYADQMMQTPPPSDQKAMAEAEKIQTETQQQQMEQQLAQQAMGMGLGVGGGMGQNGQTDYGIY